MNRQHLADFLGGAAERYPDSIATRVRVGDGWRTQTFSDFAANARRVAAGLIDSGIEVGDRVALFAANCPEWSEVDFGCVLARAISVPLYSTSSPEQIRHILSDSG